MTRAEEETRKGLKEKDDVLAVKRKQRSRGPNRAKY